MFKGAGRRTGRIVAIGDLHGNYTGLHRILQKTGILDRRDRWVAHDTRLVQLGDILGRGGEPGKIFRLLKRLEQEAPAHGSSVHVLLGNHEAMSMTGMLMYNTLEEFRDLAEEDLLETSRGGAAREDRSRGASPPSCAWAAASTSWAAAISGTPSRPRAGWATGSPTTTPP